MTFDPTSYSAPSVAVGINEDVFLELVDAEVSTSRIHPVDLAKLVLRADRTVKKDDKVRLYMGYDDELHLVFGGQVVDVSDEQTMTVSAADAMQRLKDLTGIRQSFVDCTPKEIAAWLCSKVNLVAAIGEAPARHNFLLDNVNGLEALRLVQEAWGLDWDLYAEPTGLVYWGPAADSPRAQQPEAHVLEYGQSLLQVIPGSDDYTLKCMFNPYIRHSQRVLVYDPVLIGAGVFAVVDRAVHRYAAQETEIQCRLVA
jgi:hypothetical protein